MTTDLIEEEFKIIKPEFMVCRIDETRFWSEDVQSRVDKIWCMYVYDKTRNTYCCEMTPSYCLEYLGTDFDAMADVDYTEEEIEAIDLILQEGDNESIRYYHCRAIDSMNPENNKLIEISEPDVDEYNTQEAYDDLYDAVFDAERCDPTF